eukprot:m51a1_g14503 hypothetical protein (428) ;mRNA; f:798210-803493
MPTPMWRSLLTCSQHCTCAIINTATVITSGMIDVIVPDHKEITANCGWGQQDQPSARSIWSASDVEMLKAITFSECQKLFGHVTGALDKIRTSETPFIVLAASTESVCRQYEGALTQGAYEALVCKIVGTVTERVEQAVAQRRYNQLGAQQQQSGVLTRLSHMAEFLSVERLGEVTRALAACPGLRELVVKNAVPPPDFTAAVAEHCRSLSTLRLLFPSGDRYLYFQLLRGLAPLAEAQEVLEVVCRSSGHAVFDTLASLERLEVLDLHRWSWGARAQRSVCELLRRCTRVRDIDLSEVSYGEPLNATYASVRALVPALAVVEDLRLGSSKSQRTSHRAAARDDVADGRLRGDAPHARAAGRRPNAPRLRWARVALDAPDVEAMARLRERRKGLVGGSVTSTATASMWCSYTREPSFMRLPHTREGH